MMRKIILLLWFAIPFFCMAQSLRIDYDYDASGNRKSRKTIDLTPLLAPPAPPQDSTFTDFPVSTESEYAMLLTDFSIPEESEYATFLNSQEETSPFPFFVETLDQVKIKIYPNPTTEKVTLEISGWGDLQTGVFKLYSLVGQLLQEQPVRSFTTTVSLTGMPAGTYILKVHINDRVEDWKIIKQ
ncbi:MAG: T9SS type A sorting domain-containing protein [Bacteroidetes bacterium]|nr:T9SS type A sorting domain-containing protein [Bacteroidota bacterium]MCL2303232.1 T9SS type A sorting domain-containing protein [Lentimicrobiaceae bacterium]